MADYKIKLVKDANGDNMALSVVDVTDGESFAAHIVPGGEGKNLAVPTINVGKLTKDGEIILPDSNLANYCAGSTSTAATTVNKVVDGIGTGYVPQARDFLAVTFLVANSAANITLSINGVAYPVKFAGANINTTTAGYPINTQVLYVFDGTNFNQIGSYRNTDANDAAQHIHLSTIQLTNGANPIYGYKIVAEGADGKLYPLVLENSTATTKSAQTQPLKFNGKLFCWSSSTTIASNANTASNLLQLQTTQNSANIFTYGFNGFGSITEKSNIYLVGTINTAGDFVLDNTSATSWYTNAIPTVENGKVYRLIGYRGTGNYVSLGLAHGLLYYYYKGGKVKEYIHFISPKLDGIAEGANNYTHPTTAGNKHIPAGGALGQFLKWSADGTAVWGTISTNDTGGIPATQKGAANGVASLGTDGKVPAAQLPSYVDDVHEYANFAAFPTPGESGKIYIALDTNKTYRWSGSEYAVISESLAIGETDSTAFSGSRGKTLETAMGVLSSLTTNVKTSIVNAINSIVTVLSNKVDKVTGKDLSANDFTDTLKTKLDGIAANANNYTHPTTAGNKHVPSGGATGQVLGYGGSSGTATWQNLRPTVYYGTVATAAATVNKVVSGLPADYTPMIGDSLQLKWTVANSVASPTLSINSVTYPLQFRGANLTGSAYYTIPLNQITLLTYTGTAWEFPYNADWTDNDTIANTNIGGNNLIAGEQITRYKICMKGLDGKLYPLCVGDVTTATKTASTRVFDPFFPVLWWYNSGTLAAAAKATNGMYMQIYFASGNIQYAFNGFTSADFNKPVFLVGTIAGGGFMLDKTNATSWYTTVTPTTVDNKVYIPIGVVGDNANTINFMNIGVPMQYQNGILAPYSASSAGDVANQNPEENDIKIWRGTAEQYFALTNINPNVLYFINQNNYIWTGNSTVTTAQGDIGMYVNKNAFRLKVDPTGYFEPGAIVYKDGAFQGSITIKNTFVLTGRGAVIVCSVLEGAQIDPDTTGYEGEILLNVGYDGLGWEGVLSIFWNENGTQQEIEFDDTNSGYMRFNANSTHGAGITLIQE
ncbi:MAG: hypothetical protein LBL65_05510 [Campylobacteraceae bacterium]|jgi:hypothetical protein|nr:hypothetical protein [Campylobacteraceae bacterium]